MDPTGRLGILRNKKGIALIYVALLISAMFGFVGLAVDVGHLYVVRGELQNAADAAALAGAWSLYRDPLDPGGAPVLNWERARAAAADYVRQNKSEGANLDIGVIEVGYWSPLSPDAPLSTVSTGPNQEPAVRVTVSRADGNNGGPVRNFFVQILNASFNETPVSSRPAVARAGGFPDSVAPNILFPMAISSCMADDIFEKPPAQWPSSIDINSPYGPGGPDCYSGQWTSFKLDTNDVPTILKLMDEGNPDPLAVGDKIWIQPGEEGTLYQPKQWPDGLPPGGMDVVLAIVDTEDTDLKTKGERKITGFATFHIDGTVATGNNKRIFGHFTDYSTSYPPGISGGGTTTSNIVLRPLMVQ